METQALSTISQSDDEQLLNQIQQFAQEVLADCSLKKGKKANFIKHCERANQMYEQKQGEMNSQGLLSMAALYKNIGKLGEHEESLERAIELIERNGHYRGVAIRWSLQLAALKSSRKKNSQCYQIAVRAFSLCSEMLKQFKQSEQPNSEMWWMIGQILKISEQETKDEIVWLYNQRSLAEEMVGRLKRETNERVTIPYFESAEFHIADYMSLQQCGVGWQNEKPFDVQQAIIYLSISCFTMATEKYYQKDYSQKNNHLKALRLALLAFNSTCSYVQFLLKILHQHFGQRLQSIVEERSETADAYDMRRALPKDKKEVSLKYLTFVD